MFTYSGAKVPCWRSSAADNEAPPRTASRMSATMRREASSSGSSSRIVSARSSGWPAPSRVASWRVNCTRRSPASGLGLNNVRQFVEPLPCPAGTASTGRCPCSCRRAATSAALAASISPASTWPSVSSAL